MSELLVRVTDKRGQEQERSAGCVLAAKPDGWGWTPTEQTHPDWRVVRVTPDLPPIVLEALLAPPAKDGRSHRVSPALVRRIRDGETLLEMTEVLAQVELRQIVMAPRDAVSSMPVDWDAMQREAHLALAAAKV